MENLFIFRGKIRKVFPQQTFNGSNGVIRKRSLLLETNERYPQRVSAEVFGDLADKPYAEGLEVTAYLSLHARQSKTDENMYFNSVEAWKVEF